MANPFDQFDIQQSSPNPFDRFDNQQIYTDPTAGMSTGEKLLAGIGKGFVDIGRGVGQRLGLVSQADIDAAKQLDQPLMQTGAGQVGNVIGNVAAALPTIAIPGAATIPGAMAVGAGLGAIQPTATGESVVGNAALGAAGGAVGAAAPRILARVVNPNAVQTVQQSIGNLTPGQALGGAFKTAEEKATSLPFAGPLIQQAQKESLEDFNRVVLNKVLQPIGETTDKIGNEGIQDVGDLISNSYKQLLPQLKIQQDPEFTTQIEGLKNLINSGDLPVDKATQLNNIIDNQVLGKFTDSGLMSGDTMKQVDSKLGQLIRGYQSSPDFDTRQMANALRETQASLRDMVARNNPEQAPQLNSINDAFAKFVRIERAAGMQGAGSQGGIFTPGQLMNSVRATDTSLRKGQFARGNALFQDIAQQAQQTIGNKYPDSGTAGRTLAALGAGGAYFANPLLAAGEGGLAAVYGIPQVRNALMALIARRPEAAADIANQLRLAAPTTGRIGAIGGATYANQQ